MWQENGSKEMVYWVVIILSTRISSLKLLSVLCDLWLFDYSGAYIAVKGESILKGRIIVEIQKLIFKNNAPFRSWISQINITFVDNSEDLDIVMLMLNLLEYSVNYSMASGNL